MTDADEDEMPMPSEQEVEKKETGQLLSDEDVKGVLSKMGIKDGDENK